MTRIRSRVVCDRDELLHMASPRDDVVVKERCDALNDEQVASDRGESILDLDHGPFRQYRRRLTWSRATPTEDFEVNQEIDFKLAIPYWSWLFSLPIRFALRRGLTPGSRPWWSTPDRLSERQARIAATVALLNVVGGLLYGLLTQALTFAAADLGDGTPGEQTSLLAAVRLGVVVTMLAMLLADRIGRRRVAIWAFGTSAALTLLAAFSPTLWALGIFQFVSRNLAVAGLLCADTIAVEEMPPGSRAMVSSLATLAYGLGAGIIVMTLPLADLGQWGWRLTFGVAGLSLPLIWHAGRRLPESRRYLILDDERQNSESQHGATRQAFRQLGRHVSLRRLILVGAIFFLLNVFLAPTSQLQNDYMRVEVGFSGLMISVFTLLTSTPGGLGVLLGGKLADLRGRRWAIAPGLSAIAVFYTLFFSTRGPAMWLSSLAASILGGLAAPALAVIAPELFPTARRGTVRGIVTGLAIAGSVVGLLLAGQLIDNHGYRIVFTMMAVAPLIAAALALALPETRGRELEEINR